MKVTKDAEKINGTVKYSSNVRIWVDYYFNDEKYRIEIPVTMKNRHLKNGDEIEMQLLMTKELK